jgi:hypothetical protein
LDGPLLLQVSGFRSALRGTAVQQQRAVGRSPAARLAVHAAGTQTATKRLKVGQRAPKPPPPPPRKAASPTTGTKKIRPTVSGTGTKKVGGPGAGTKAAGTRKVTAIEVFSSEKQFRAKQQSARPAPKVLRCVGACSS